MTLAPQRDDLATLSAPDLREQLRQLRVEYRDAVHRECRPVREIAAERLRWAWAERSHRWRKDVTDPVLYGIVKRMPLPLVWRTWAYWSGRVIRGHEVVPEAMFMDLFGRLCDGELNPPREPRDEMPAGPDYAPVPG